MSEHSIPIIRGSQLLPFIRRLEDYGKASAPLLRECHCPINADLENTDCIIPTNRLWQFIERTAQILRNRNNGWDTAAQYGVYGGGRFAYELENQENLRAAIIHYNRLIHQHASVSYGDSTEDGEYVWFYRATIPSKGTDFFQVEQYALGTLRHIVRSYVGAHWNPRRIAIASKPRSPNKLSIANDCGELIVGAKRGAIEVPVAKLGASPKKIPASLENPGGLARPFPTELPRILVEMLKNYYPDYQLTQESVSAIVQMHPRTLNRRLAEYGMSYRGIRNEVLMEKATHALSATDLSLATISVLLGYANQSAFSRAFTQLTGITPLKYRQKGLNPDTSSQSR